MANWTRIRSRACWLLPVLSLGALLFFGIGTALTTNLFQFDSAGLRISDFAYHVLLTRALWFEGLGDPYSFSDQQALLSRLIGASFSWAMPVAVLPSAWIIWFPFAVLARWNLNAAQAVWNGVTIGAFAYFSLKILARARNESGKLRIAIAITVTALSFASFHAARVGQTAFMAAATLCYLVQSFERKDAETSQPSAGALFSCLFLLSMKPFYAIFGCLLLLGRGQARVALQSLLAIACVLGLGTALTHYEWFSSYRAALDVYTNEIVPEEYRQSLAFESLNIFRSAFASLIGAQLALDMSRVLSVLAVFSSGLALVLVGIFPKRASARPMCSALALIGIIMLFSPYQGGYEDLLLVPLVLTTLGSGPPCSRLRASVLLSLLTVSLNAGIFLPHFSPPLLWSCKCALLALLAWTSSQTVTPRTQG